MNLTEPERRILMAAREMLVKGTDAPAFTARFFGPREELSRLGNERNDRQRILKSELYRWLKAKYEELRLREARQFDQELKLGSE